MQYATVTSIGPPPCVRRHEKADVNPVPVADWPDGLTLAVDDVVLVESIDRKVVVVARMASTP